MHVPVFDKDKFVGTLAVVLDFRNISRQFLQNIQFGETGYAWMISARGIELYCPVPGHVGKTVFDNTAGYPAIHKMAREMMAGHEGTAAYYYDRIRGERLVRLKKQAVYMPIKVGDGFWSIVVASSEKEMLASLANLKIKLIALMFFLLLGSFVFSFYGLKAWGIIREEKGRIEAENALRRNLSLLHNIINSSADYIYVKDRDLRLLLCNEIFYRTLGKKPETLYGKTDIEIGWNPAAVEGNASEGLRSYERDDLEALGGEMVRNSDDQVEINGEMRIFDTIKLPLCDENNSIIGILGISRDVTERKRAEGTLRESEARFRRLFENALTGVALHEIVLDDHGRPVDYIFINVNPAFETMTGLTAAEIIGKKATEVFSEFEKTPFIEVFGKVALTGQSASFERFAEGLNRYFFIHAYHAGVNRFATVSMDITDIKKAQEERDQMGKELRQSQKMEALGALAGGIAHDFNNILAAMIGYAELALMEAPPVSPLAENLDQILKAGQRGKDVVRQIMDFGRGRGGEFKPLNLVDQIAESLKLLRSTMPPSVEIKQMADSRIISIRGDATQIHQVVMNLCSNAAQAMTPGGGLLEIHLSTTELDSNAAESMDINAGTYGLLTVTDTGPGMDSAILDRIFEPFFFDQGKRRGHRPWPGGGLWDCKKPRRGH